MSDSKPSTWRSVFGPDEVIQRVRPHESSRNIPNPHKGTTTFQRFNGDALYPGLRWNDKEGPLEFGPRPESLKNPQYPDTTISYCRWLWSVIEPEKGKFRWDIIDGALRAAAERGQTLQVRIQPYIGDDTPQWYWDDGGEPVDRTGQDRRRAPDHNTKGYIRHWGDLVRAFGARYDGHPVLDSFDVAYGGPCGETGGNATPETAERLVDAYLEAFHKTQLLTMLGTHGCKYAASKRADVGWRADCFGDVHEDGRGVVPDRLCWNHMLDAYVKNLFQMGVEERWKAAPVTLETCWTVGHWYKEGWDVDWILDQGLMYHLSVFMPKSSYIPEAWTDKIDAFNRRMGYHFVLRQMTLPLEARRGAKFDVETWVENVGVAPIYRPYRFAYRFRQGRNAWVVESKTDITRWLPGPHWWQDSIEMPRDCEPGVVEIDCGIVAPGASPAAPAPVRLAIEETRDDGWHPLTSMDGLSSAS